MSVPTLDLAALDHRRRRGVAALMLEVMLALVPGTLLYAWLIGPDVLVNVALATLAALAVEALALRVRSRPVLPALADGSVALAAWLLALAVPPTLPAGELLIGVAAAVLLGKHLFGGLGHNPFNPAMLGYAVLLVSFPVSMTGWPASAAAPALAPPSSLVSAQADAPRAKSLADGGKASGAASDTAIPSPGWDAVSAATPLDRLRTLEREAGSEGYDAAEQAFVERAIAGSPWPWINAGFLVGGLWLLARGAIGWRIPGSLLGTLALLHAGYGLFGGVPQPPVHQELLAGAAVLGAFFVATDPVSAPSAPRARLLYGAGIGALTFALREFGAYPEGIAFAVLLMNASVPLLDRLSGRPGTPRARR